MLSEHEKNELVENLIRDSFFDLSNLDASNEERIDVARRLVAHPQFDVSSPKNGAVFYSGDFDKDRHGQTLNSVYFLDHDAIPYTSDAQPGYGEALNRERADRVVDSEYGRGTRLERTPGGRSLARILDGIDPYKDARNQEKVNTIKADANNVLRDASQKFARSASGDTRVFSADYARNGTLASVEIPELLKNSKVTSINGEPRQNLADLYEKDPKAAMDRISARQISMGETAARSHADFPALRDVERQKVAYTRQLIEDARLPSDFGQRASKTGARVSTDQPRTKSGLRPPPASSVQRKPNTVGIEQPRTRSGLRPPPASKAPAPRGHAQAEQPKTKSGLKSPPPSQPQPKQSESSSEQLRTKAGLRLPPASKPVSDHARSAAEPQKTKSGLTMPPPPPPPRPAPDRTKGRGR